MDLKIRIRSKEIIGWREIDGKIALFNPKQQEMAILNETGSFLWKNISQWIDFQDLCRKVMDEYVVNWRSAEIDTIDFLNQLMSLDVLEISDFKKERFIQSRYQEEIRDENLLLELEKLAMKKMIPFSTTFELTQKCNEDCIHCYMPKEEADELTTEEVKNILVELAEEGCIFISFTGGEIFARPDLFEIIDFASKQKFVIDLLSNGTLIDNRVVDFLQNQIIRRVQISLYASKSEIHDKITRREGSFEKTLRAIKLLRKGKIKVEVAFSIMNINFDERYDVKNLADSFGAQFLPSHIITGRNNGSQDTFDFRINDTQLRQLLGEEIFDYYPGRKPFQEHQFYMGFKNLQEANPCYSGINSCAINPIGDLLPCNQLLYNLGSLRENSFSEIWHNSSMAKRLRSIKVKDLPECSKCSMLPYCSRCPGLALLEGDGILGPSPENCRITSIQIQNLKGDEKDEEEKNL